MTPCERVEARRTHSTSDCVDKFIARFSPLLCGKTEDPLRKGIKSGLGRVGANSDSEAIRTSGLQRRHNVGVSFRIGWPVGLVECVGSLGLNFVASIATTALLWRNPELLAERSNIKAGKSWDKAIVGIVVLLGPVATWITAGLDTRFHWSDRMPP